MSHFNIEEIDARIKIQKEIIAACDAQIESVLNHCPGVTVTEEIDNNRQSIKLMFSHVINQ